MRAAPHTPINTAPPVTTSPVIMRRLGMSPESTRRAILVGSRIVIDINRRVIPLHRYDPGIMRPGMSGRSIVHHALAERQSGTP